MDKKTKDASAIGGVIFTGCMFIGMGAGMYFHHLVEGMFIGMGTGFVAMGIVWAILKQK